MGTKLQIGGAGICCGAGCLVYLAIWAAFALVGALLWPWTINTWLEYAGKDPRVLWWHGALLGFCPVLGQLTIPAAVGTWILMLFLV